MQVLWPLGVDIDVPLWLIIILALIYAYYKYMTWHFGIFKKHGIPGPKPLPLLGNLRTMYKVGFRNADIVFIAKYGNCFGQFLGRQPELVVNDPSFVKQVVVKEFNHFVDRMALEIGEKPMNRGLTSLKGEEWRVIRNTLTPTFSGGKMKKMNQKINACSKQLVDTIGENVEKDKSFDMLEVAGNYTMDVIARTAFGLELNCQKDSNNIFVQNGKASMKGGLKSPLFIIMFFFPFALKFLTRIGLTPSMPKKQRIFFTDIVEQTLQAKKENTGKKDQDFMQLMADAHKEDTKDEDLEEENREVMQGDRNKKTTLTKDDILGNALLFFLAGYETTANTLSFVAYLLATYPDCQDKVCEEIDRVIGDQDPTYDILPEMHYLEQFLSETLRIYPQAPKLTRHCQKEITINGIFVPEGMQVGIPVLALHMNPDVWPEPEKFDPERFSPEQKANRDPYNYLPFGLGPRSCIAMRLALMEMKIAIISVLQKYKMVTCSETEIPVKLDTLRPKPANGMILKAVKRHQAQQE